MLEINCQNLLDLVYHLQFEMKKDLPMIMSEFAAIEYGMNAMSCVLKTMEEYYDCENQNELKMNVNVMKRLLDSLIEEIGKTMEELDTYIN